jgi:hypothetical protein
MKKTIIAAIMAFMCAVTFAQNAASDFIIDANGVITKYNGWDAAVVIPETVNGIRVTAIGNRAFASNDLTSVTIPRSVISIGIEAFNRNKLTSVTIPGNNVIIGNGAFNNNPITSVTLGNNHAFSAEIVPKLNNNRTESSLLYDYACNDRKAGTYTTNRAVAAEKTEADFKFIETQYGAFITGYTGSSGNRLEIPARLGNLPVKAISGFRNVSRVRIPDSVTYIGNGAFQGNIVKMYSEQLTEITIPSGVTYIGNDAFFANSLTSVTIPDSVTYIGEGAFSYNGLTSVTIPNSVTYIGGDYTGGAFSNNQLTSVTIPDSVTTIGVSAFERNQLTSVTIGNSVTTIGSSAFAYNQLTSVTIPNSVTTIGVSAFERNQLTSVTIGANVTLTLSNSGYSPSFSNGFDDFYYTNGREAGTYVRSGGVWTKQ